MEQQNNNTKKLTDKAFSRLLFTSILGILFCIVCLCSSSYAWFTGSVSGDGNEIKTAAECLLEVTVSKDGVAIDGIEEGVNLEAGEYEVTLSLPGDTASGYCLIKAGGANYYSDYILRHSGDEPQTKSFILKVETEQTVTFTNRWGIYATDSHVVDGVMLIP